MDPPASPGSVAYRTLLQFALQGAAMHAKAARSGRYIVVVFRQHPLNVLPFHSVHRWRLLRYGNDGCIAAADAQFVEHGIGIEKRELMRSNFSELDLDRRFALVYSVFDSLNNLLTDEEFRAAARPRLSCQRVRMS